MSLHHSPNSAVVKGTYAFQSVTKNSDKQATSIRILDVIANCEMIELEDQKARVFIGSRLKKQTFQVYYFSLATEFSTIKGLLNGLISLGAPNGIYLQYQKDLNTYAFKFYESDEHIASKYLQKLIQMVDGEIRFKSVLKRVITNLKAFDASQQLLKKEIFN